MELEIYTKKPKEKVKIKLARRTDGVAVVTVNEEGVQENVLIVFNNDGKIHRFGSINEDYGFQLDRERRIKVY